jgi:hypothetical protein
MQDFVYGLICLALLATLVGLARPYKGFSRKQFGWTALGLFVLSAFSVPEAPNGSATAARQEPGQARDLMAETQSATDEIAAKAKPALDSRIKYSRADNPKTVSLIGTKGFDRLNELEPGAIYVAAASSSCDKVETGAVSLTSSKKGQPRWFVDCSNGNRFMVSLAEAEEALTQYKAGKLEIGSRAHDCTQTTISECNLIPAQKSFDRAEASVLCDMIVEKSLIADSDMDWGSNMNFGEDGEVVISRGFTAQNAFGADLKHRYFCTLDAGTKRIKRLVIEGPMGSQKLI